MENLKSKKMALIPGAVISLFLLGAASSLNAEGSPVSAQNMNGVQLAHGGGGHHGGGHHGGGHHGGGHHGGGHHGGGHHGGGHHGGGHHGYHGGGWGYGGWGYGGGCYQSCWRNNWGDLRCGTRCY